MTLFSRQVRGVEVSQDKESQSPAGPNGQAVGPEIHAEAWTDALGRSRTFNLQIKSLLLCQLSYECKILKRRRVRGSW